MDIRLFCCRCFVFPGLWVGYEAKDGNQTTHQRTDDVEEAEGEIDKLVFHLLCIFILVDRCIHNNAQELVTHNEIEQDA